MANPVMNRLEKEWQNSTPAGYPTMPGYEPGAAGSYAQQAGYAGATAAAQRTMQPTYEQGAFAEAEAAYRAPAADAVDRGRMTYDDVLVKSGIAFGVLFIGATIGWFAAAVSPAAGALVMGAGFLVAFILAMVNIFGSTIRPALILAYAAFEGLALGAISAFMEFSQPGIVIQALLATAAVFGVTLLLFTSGKVRNSPKLARFTLISLVGILVYRLLNFVLVLTGVLSTPRGFDDVTIFGIPLGVAVGVLAVLVGAASLIQDFDQIKRGVEMGAPAKFAWACTFAVMVTVVWMYLEILRLLSRLRN
ncbi:MAG: Bax1 inhibitor-like family protein [Actinobacteria bacterium]|nr:MAG: Bax1 inhibitor-like family protein [Actinomycetota bacterium]